MFSLIHRSFSGSVHNKTRSPWTCFWHCDRPERIPCLTLPVWEKMGLPSVVSSLPVFDFTRFLHFIFQSKYWFYGRCNQMEQFRFFCCCLSFGPTRYVWSAGKKDRSQSLICNTIDMAIMTPWQYRVMGDSDLWPQPMNTFSLGQRSVIYFWQYCGFWSRRAGHVGHWMGQSLTRQDVVQLLLSFPSVKVFRIHSPLRLLLLYGERLMGLHRRRLKWCALTRSLNAKRLLNVLTGKC